MKVLFVCYSHMQVIIAIQMKLKLYRDYEADIIISAHSIGADKFAAGLEKTGLFRRVKCINLIQLDYERNLTMPQKLSEIFTIPLGRSTYNELLWDDDFVYDEICYYNPFKFVYVAYSLCVHERKKYGITGTPICNAFEEGIFSSIWTINNIIQLRKNLYRSNKRLWLFHALNKLFGRKDIIRSTKKFTCFFPELIDNKEAYEQEGFSFIKLPLLKADPDFLRILNTAFNYDPSAANFPQKYIYFATATDIDGIPLGETELVLKLADLVGKDNLLVKMHTRDNRTIYKDNGLNVMPHSSTPWEVMQLNHDFSGHVFVSISSGSILNMTAMKNDSIPSYYLYPMLLGESEFIDNFSKVMSSVLTKLQALGLCKSIKSIDNLQDIVM